MFVKRFWKGDLTGISARSTAAWYSLLRRAMFSELEIVRIRQLGVKEVVVGLR